MPLTRERRGLFRGRANNQVAWYVVSPAIADPDAEAELWRSGVAKSNSHPALRVIATTLGWATFVAVLAGSWALLWFVAEQEWPGWPLYVGVVGTLAFVLAALLGMGVGVSIGAAEYVPAETDTVMPVDEAVARWADDEVDVGQLWDLTYELSAVSEFENFRAYGSGEDSQDRPLGAVEKVVGPVLDQHLEAHRTRLREVADRLGYPLDPDLRATSSR